MTAADASSIQPAGFLLALSEDWAVEAVSASIGDFLAVPAHDLIGRPASAMLAEDAIHALRNRLALLRDRDGVERLLACPLTGSEQKFDLALHDSGGRIVVEAEPATARRFGDVIGTLRGMFARLDLADELTAMLAAAARQMRALTGFDQVLILRFEPDGASRIVAEFARGGVASVLGKRLPANRFPTAERRCLERAGLHLNADLTAGLTPLIVAPGSEPLDLSRAMLRPVAPAYGDQWLGMGARAVLSIALTVGGTLWGIIACLHHQPRTLGFERRSIADLFAQLLAPRIEIFELKAAFARPAAG